MCNIAGYIGARPAAPILIEMLRAQEGLNAGFYTGIATLHEGVIHYRKVVGNLSDLLHFSIRQRLFLISSRARALLTSSAIPSVSAVLTFITIICTALESSSSQSAREGWLMGSL